jgi:putative phosphoesterase
VIGDVHTESGKLRLALDHLARLSLDRILCTGDVPDGPADVTELETCCRLLRERDVITVSGNHDRWLQDGEMRELPDATDPCDLSAAALEFLAALPATVEFDSPAGRVLLCHGMGTDDMHGVQPFDHGLALDNNSALQALLRDGRYDFVISGHTHRPMVRKLRNLTVINAGTLLRNQGPCCAMADFDERRVRFYEIGERSVNDSGSEWIF